ncbi:hypothetical protein [Thiosocius teredinicola]|uniref:hypothetical protein n=1 Tax=Thiosocius teredinicola TaxID=1973002 RepID=UPI000F7AD7EC
MLRKISKIVFFLLICIALAIVLLQIDDPLEPEVATLIQMAEPQTSSQAYLYLLGLHAPPAQDPLELGKQRLASTLRAGSVDPLSPHDSDPSEILAIPEGELFCRTSDDGCQAKLFGATDEFATVIESNKTLLDRYRAFLALNDFATLQKAGLDDELPIAYRHLKHGHRLLMLNTILTARNGQAEQAGAELHDTIDALRRKLETADTLLSKMIFTTLVSESLDTLSVLVRQSATTTAQLAPLSPAEKSLKKPIAHELRGMHSFYSELDQGSDDPTLPAQWPHWVRRMFFKPNMSSNAGFIYYRDALTLVDVPPVDFAAKVRGTTFEEPPRAWLRNYGGSILAGIAGPAMNRYVESIFDLDAKIALFNASITDPSMTSIVGRLPNPYFTTGEFAYLSDSGNAVCFASASKNADAPVCLLVATDGSTTGD